MDSYFTDEKEYCTITLGWIVGILAVGIQLKYIRQSSKSTCFVARSDIYDEHLPARANFRDCNTAEHRGYFLLVAAL